MNKDAAAWLALRIIGLLALGRALLSLFSTPAEIFYLSKLYGAAFAGLASQTHQMLIQMWVGIGMAFVQSIFFALVAFYFLRRGRAIHKLLMHESTK